MWRKTARTWRGRKFTSRALSSRKSRAISARGRALPSAAGMLGLLTVQMLVFGIVLLLGDALFRGNYWIAAFVLTAILGGGRSTCSSVVPRSCRRAD